ncbi:hypothetical protein GCM10022243_48970 [Saccharothrix violaceirubra]|uniref:Uncharacterized protein n=1 Tax=Saccharothrix violaceirubra TaxID=413306 RepID=A0A7W7SZY0_9PSEU|nr:hypothetical protein [Saccharothrix violaceirubra]MBB4963761.1 hypothetical protein [Saccharothrix violaceirubra]
MTTDPLAYFEDETLPDHWSNGDLAAEITRNDPVADARVVWILAARVATAGAANTDPLHTLHDLGRAVAAITVTADAIIRDRFDDLDAEETTDFRSTIDHLVAAAKGLDDLSGWF